MVAITSSNYDNSNCLFMIMVLVYVRFPMLLVHNNIKYCWLGSFKKSCRYQRRKQNPYIEEQTTQRPKEKVQKDKQRSKRNTHKTKDRVTRTPLKTRGDLRCSWMISSSCSNFFGSKYNVCTAGTKMINTEPGWCQRRVKYMCIYFRTWLWITISQEGHSAWEAVVVVIVW